MCDGSQASSSSSTSSLPSYPQLPQGTKRRGDDAVNSEQRLSKRFHLLDIGNEKNESLWIPPSTTVPALQKAEITTRPRETDDASSSMQIDDTKDKIYIRNLDEELNSASDVSDEERILFLPDVEKKLSKIPKHLLQGNSRPRITGTEMVLYSVPSSLSLPVEQDSVRRAILESRARAREKANKDALLHDYIDRTETPKQQERQVTQANTLQHDVDLMDIG